MGKRRSLKPGGKDEPSDDEDDYDEDTLEPLKPEQIEEIHSRKKLTAKRRINESSLNSTKSNPFSGFSGFGTTSTTSTTSATKAPSILQNGSNKAESSSSSSSLIIDNKQQNETNLNIIEVNFIQDLNKLYEKYYGNKREYKLPSHLIDNNESDKTNYAQLLMELNKHISKWIGKHVEESPFVYLTPIFIDYFNYLIHLEKRFFPNNSLFTKTENGIHNIKTSSSLLINGTKSSSVIETPPAPLPTVINQFEEISTIKTSSSFPSLNTNAQFKFTPIPITTAAATATTPTIVAPTTSKLDIFGLSSSSSTSSPFSFTTSTTTTTTTNKSSIETTNSSFFNKSTTIENKKVETESSPTIAKFNFGINKEIVSASKTETNKGSSSIFSPPAPNLFASYQKPQQQQPTSSIFSPSTNQQAQAPTLATSASIFQQQPTTSNNFFSQLPATNSLFSSTTKTAASNDSPTTTTTQAQKGGFFSTISSNQTNPLKPFSFGNLTPASSLFGGGGGGTSFGFSSQQPQQIKQQSNNEAGDGEGGGDDEAYEPPKPEVKEILEDGALYSKRIKLFYFNTESNQYVDRGIGNLHIKLTSDGAKKQMIIRAETSLGNILLNVALTKQMPVSKISKNRLVMICIANPPIPKHDDKTPCKFLIQVKTEEETNELLDKINEMKN